MRMVGPVNTDVGRQRGNQTAKERDRMRRQAERRRGWQQKTVEVRQSGRRIDKGTGERSGFFCSLGGFEASSDAVSRRQA